MEQLILDIAESLEKKSEKEMDASRGKHIFTSLEKFFGPQLDENKAALYYYMTISEKALVHYRNREKAQGDYYFLKAEGLTEHFSEPVLDGMTNLHLAISAYRNYVNNEFDTAEKELDLAIDYAVKQSETFPGFISVIGEQWLNKIRIYIKKKDMAHTISQTIQLLHLILYGIHENPAIENSYKSVETEDRIGMLDHVINSIHSAYESSFKETDSFYLNICDHIVVPDRASINNDVLSGYLLLKYNSSDTESFVKHIHENRNILPKLPVSMQKKIFTKIFLNPEKTDTSEINGHEKIKLLKQKYRIALN
ncbi:MAG: hypothetical protein MUW56_03195 [Chryseobacterium sp.]|uniref:hypothetical protein n=1 Tax=Chryseobacterium sp. TaxID=1871047 RepID=UPI0025B7C736|nr:hypothetical protein [Chryseobacterium sp.]MCJ7932653.1 hypothetical protein [Chryseobacterium sp.]